MGHRYAVLICDSSYYVIIRSSDVREKPGNTPGQPPVASSGSFKEGAKPPTKPAIASTCSSRRRRVGSCTAVSEVHRPPSATSGCIIGLFSAGGTAVSEVCRPPSGSGRQFQGSGAPLPTNTSIEGYPAALICVLSSPSSCSSDVCEKRGNTPGNEVPQERFRALSEPQRGRRLTSPTVKAGARRMAAHPSAFICVHLRLKKAPWPWSHLGVIFRVFRVFRSSKELW